MILVCFLLSHARPRVRQAPGIPRALCFLWGHEFASTRARSALRECEDVSSLRANGSREPDDKLRDAIQKMRCEKIVWIASSHALRATTVTKTKGLFEN